MSVSRRLWLHGFVLALVLSGSAADGGWTPERVREVVRDAAARHGTSGAALWALIGCEVGPARSPWRADGSLVFGSAGEIGVSQWHPRGIWWSTPVGRTGVSIHELYRSGDPSALETDVEMLAWSIAAGYGAHWTCWRRAA